MNQTEHRIAQLEGEIRVLKTQLEQAERKNENLIRKSDSTFRAVFDHSADGMMLIGKNGIVREWNYGQERITGLEKESVVGKMLLWEVSELIFPFEKFNIKELNRIKDFQKDIVANMKYETFVRQIKNCKTGEYRILQVVFFPVATPDDFLLGAICRDVTEEELYREQIEELNEYQTHLEWVLAEKTSELIEEHSLLQAIGDNFPDGALFRFEINPLTFEMNFTYLSTTWEVVTGLNREESMADVTNAFAAIFPKHIPSLMEEIEKCTTTLQNFFFEAEYHKGSEPRWMQLSSTPRKIADYKVVFNGFILDITARKLAEQELLNEHERLRAIGDNFPDGSLFRFEINPLNMEMGFSYLSATWEEVMGVSIEDTISDASTMFNLILPEFFESHMEEIKRCTLLLQQFLIEYKKWHKDNEIRWIQVSSYPKWISEDRVVFDGFVLDITKRKENEIELEKLSDRRAILIKVLHIVQAAEDLSEAMNQSIAEIGRYAGVSRVNVFEISEDGTTVSNTFGWCNDGIESIIDSLQNIPIEVSQSWFDMFDADMYICTSGINTLKSALVEVLTRCGVKSAVVLPLSSGSFNYGYVGFDECIASREWDENEVEMLKNLSKIISVVKRRFQAEASLRRSHQTMHTVLNNINANIVVTDFETMKILFVNDPLRKMVGEEMEGKDCWKLLQVGQSGVCDFCPKNHLLDSNDCSTGVYCFEHYFDKFKKHMVVDAVATEWIDGRRVLLEVIFDITDRKLVEQKLLMEHDRLRAIGDNFPHGSLFRFEINPLNMEMGFSYLSATWEEVMRISIEETIADSSRLFDMILPEFTEYHTEEIKKCSSSLQHFLIEYKKWHKDNEIRWIQVSSHPKKIADDKIIFDGFVLDITTRKENEIELAKYREELEFLVKEHTEELQIANEELKTYNEELQSINEELYSTSEALHAANEKLDRYKTQLEKRVKEKTTEIIDRKEELEKLNRRQEVFIKVLQILQLEEDVSEGMNMVLDIIGNYTHVDRVQIWENNTDGITYGCSNEWCNEGVEPVIHFCQNLPLEHGKPWFDLLNTNNIICTSDIYSLTQPIYEMLERQYVKAIVVIPLSIYGSHFGFISFTVCEDKVWDEKEVELLTNISQVFSNVTRRRQVETAMSLSQQTMRTVLDNINAHILVTEYDSLKILFANNNFIQEAGEDVEGMFCWQSLKVGLTGPCEHCPRSVLCDSNGLPTGVHYREDYHPKTKRWFVIISTAIRWVSGQLAIMELATDITDRKLNEIELVHAREKAEESDKLKSAFLANMSHEIRTPINGIVGFLHFIASNDLSPERKQNYINIIKNSAVQLVQLIDDIIDVSKIEAKQMNMFPVPIDVNQLMCELQIFFETILQTKNKSHLMLILDDSGFIDKCIATVDPVRLRQVISNLMINAIKYTEKGYIRFGYRQSAPDKLEFAVEDTGIGMVADQHEIIFERFRQAGNHFRGGTGLGLNIAQSLVQMMGGDIWVESTEGAGSTFYFTILYRPVHLEDEKE